MHENEEEEGEASRSSIRSPVNRQIPTRTQSHQETVVSSNRNLQAGNYDTCLKYVSIMSIFRRQWKQYFDS